MTERRPAHGRPSYACPLRALSALALLCAALFAPRHATAQDERFAFGAELDLGGATLVRPNDEPGEPTLLAGSAFTGPAFRLQVVGEGNIAGPLWIGGTIGAHTHQLHGYASDGVRRRELTLSSTSIELGLRARLSAQQGKVRPLGGFGLVGRFGLHSSSVEQTIGFVDNRQPLKTASGHALILNAEAGMAIVHGQLVIPITFQAGWNATQGSSTRERTRDYINLHSPGAYVVNATWDYGLRVGLLVRL